MIGAALGELELAAIFAELRNQEHNGHTAESDAELAIATFGDTAVRFAGELRDVLRPGDRQNLDVAYRRAARVAAFAISTARRIRHEQKKGAGSQ